MNGLSRFLVDLNDIYGRIIPGSIIVVNLYFILGKTSYHDPLRDATTWLYTDSKAFFVVILLLLAYLVGSIPLFLIFRFIADPIRDSAAKLLNGIDPTLNTDIKTFYEKMFTKEALGLKANTISNYCKQSLLLSNSESYKTLCAIEYASNLKAGLAFALLVSSITCTLYGHIAIAVLLLLSSWTFVWSFRRTLITEDRTALWLFYAVNRIDSSAN